MVRFCVYGQSFQLHGADEALARRLLEENGWEPGGVQEEVEAGRFDVSRQGEFFSLAWNQMPVLEAQPWALVAAILRSRVLETVVEKRDDLVFVRGDVVVGRDGRAVVLPGPSLSGKTRLARALISAGATPWSEHFAVFDSSGLALSFPRRSAEGVPVGAVLQLHYRAGAEFSQEALTSGQTVIGLTSVLRVTPERVPQTLRLLGEICSQARMRCRGFRGDTGPVLAALGSQPGIL